MLQKKIFQDLFKIIEREILNIFVSVRAGNRALGGRTRYRAKHLGPHLDYLGLRSLLKTCTVSSVKTTPVANEATYFILLIRRHKKYIVPGMIYI